MKIKSDLSITTELPTNDGAISVGQVMIANSKYLEVDIFSCHFKYLLLLLK
ncbi:MAG: hypothetical protein U9N76_05195 [Candidatus Marinimicrobia bacterium]|nr:hypothetical protein [Candidatus Neomarinimicrobiota bacterium]